MDSYREATAKCIFCDCHLTLQHTYTCFRNISRVELNNIQTMQDLFAMRNVQGLISEYVIFAIKYKIFIHLHVLHNLCQI